VDSGGGERNSVDKIIIMVNNPPRNISRYPERVPDAAVTGRTRTIANAPIYDPNEVLALAQAGKIMLWTPGARRDAAKWSIDTTDVSELIIAALQGRGRFQTAEWCEEKPNGPWAARDAWIVTRNEWIEQTKKWMETTYYLKFAMARTGEILLMASIHPEYT